MVLDEEFVMNIEEIRRKLCRDLPRRGHVSMPKKFNHIEVCQFIYDNPRITKFERDVKKMDLDNHLLHLIVSQVINQRVGCFTRASKEEIWIMFYFIKEIPLEIGGIMVRKMIEAVRWSKREQNKNALPYGKFVTTMIRRECVVNDDELVGNSEVMELVNNALPSLIGWAMLIMDLSRNGSKLRRKLKRRSLWRH